MSQSSFCTIAIIGAGTIGLSFAALHLSAPSELSTRVIIYDPRPYLSEYIGAKLPGLFGSHLKADVAFYQCASINLSLIRAEYLSALATTPGQVDGAERRYDGLQFPSATSLMSTGRLVITSSLAEAVKHADIVQEQGPEKVDFKQRIWSEIEALAPPDALFWSSTSGIPASVQSKQMKDKRRLTIVHPFNPPHIMPLLEIIRSEATECLVPSPTSRTLSYWEKLGRKPVVLQEEITGFVANRLAFALFREAAYLVERGIASVVDIDHVVEQSLGPRWAVRGPFWSYHAGGGEERGLAGFLDKIGDTIQACWDDLGDIQLRHAKDGAENPPDWQGRVCEQVEAAYGRLGVEALRDRDEKLQGVLNITKP